MQRSGVRLPSAPLFLTSDGGSVCTRLLHGPLTLRPSFIKHVGQIVVVPIERQRIVAILHAIAVGIFFGFEYGTNSRRIRLAFVQTPEDTLTNCRFGGADLKTLYITCGSLLLSLPTKIAGKASYRPARQQE